MKLSQHMGRRLPLAGELRTLSESEPTIASTGGEGGEIPDLDILCSDWKRAEC